MDDSDELNVNEIWQNEDLDKLDEFDDGLNEFQDDFNAEDIWQDEDSKEIDEFNEGLYGLQNEDEEIGKIKATTYKFSKTLANLIKIPGSNFDDSDDLNAEEILQNEYTDKSDEFDNGLHVLEDGDEELGKIKAST